MLRIRFLLAAVVLLSLVASARAQQAEPIKLDVAKYDAGCDVKIRQQGTTVVVTWPLPDAQRGQMAFNLASDGPLLQELGVASSPDAAFVPVAKGLDPLYLVRVGQRNLTLRGGWTIFFDRMQEKPHTVHLAKIGRTRASAESNGGRATLTIGETEVGPFRGELRWTFYAGEPFVLQEAVLETEQNAVAYLYDTGFVGESAGPQSFAWHKSTGGLQTKSAEQLKSPQNIAVRGRTVAAQFESGSLAVFPPPHRYFYPLDFSNNYSNIWLGPKYAEQDLPLGFGIRHDPKGDNRFVPWFNAPPLTKQELGVFLYLSASKAEQTLADVAKLTHKDTFVPLAGHTRFSSHYHVEHTQDLLNSQSDDAPATGKLPSGGSYRIPKRLENPGFMRTFRERGLDVVHLAEFHFGTTPKMKTDERLRYLEHLHAECERLSNDKFLLLPGEEPNVHFGGHWISLFPKPVYWVLNRPEGTPFVEQHPQLGPVYHVGGEADLLRLLQAEQGLAWTAHARIKGSTGFPDKYRQQLFFQSDRFLGAAWKAMPADLSQPRLGSRVLDLMSDMENWGEPKYVLGEVDVFKIEPDHELYAHMNVNYLKLDKIPRFTDGWQPILDTLRAGKFFVTTGEILIPQFTVNGKESGQGAQFITDQPAKIAFDLQWTFPLAYAEIISGDGKDVFRQRVDLSQTNSFGKQTFTVDAPLAGRKWARLEVWDIATNGAFTQPVWLSNSP